MPVLRVLPSNIANMIAAGEVVQRPSSVVKELMENALDAGADDISVVIADAGRTLIQVIDNGCGMSADDAVLCFERHATSKIASVEDLDRIMTFGFRGEALASIGAVAEVTLRTRLHDSELGTEVVFSDSKLVGTSEVASPRGTSISVRNLFFNVPARRKFLKSDNVEFKHIVEEFDRVVLTRPDVSFSLIHNGKAVHLLKSAKSLKFRILDLLGSNVASDILDMERSTSLMTVSGFVGRPDTARKTSGNQYFFVNGRYLRSGYLHKAVMKAYEEFVPQGYVPSYFIYIQLDPSSIDVNISPTKTEIKFEDDSIIFQTLYAITRDILGHSPFSASIDFDTEGAIQLPVLNRSFDDFRPGVSPSKEFDTTYNPFDVTPIAGDYDFSNYSPMGGESAPCRNPVEPREDYGKLFESKIMPSTQVLVVKDRYLVTAAASGLMLVHIRRAFERVMYEDFLRALSAGGHVSQASLFPEQVKVGVKNRLLFDEHTELLKSLGFDIYPFGNDTVVVNAVPAGYSCEGGKVEDLVDNLILILSDNPNSLGETMYSRIAEKFAILGSTTAKLPSTTMEAQHLIDSLFACDNAGLTSRGHRVVSIITLEQLEKYF